MCRCADWLFINKEFTPKNLLLAGHRPGLDSGGAENAERT